MFDHGHSTTGYLFIDMKMKGYAKDELNSEFTNL